MHFPIFRCVNATTLRVDRDKWVGVLGVSEIVIKESNK